MAEGALLVNGVRYLETRKRMVLELVREAFSTSELEQLATSKKQKQKEKDAK